MRIVTLAALALATVLAGCDSFDPLDKFQDWDLLSSKTPLKGERRDVFPQGVPGVPQGVPPDMVKGYQPPPEQPPPVVEATAEKKQAKKKKAVDPAAPPPKKTVRKKTAPQQEAESPDQPMQQAPAAGTTQTQRVQQAPGGFQTMPGAQPTWPSNAQPAPTR
ncbi:MAG: hypothetical protein JO000_17770 [Alphaproteobacteria bacterium]|nr:hypothetical protein [Alphaproteobacteria bacterium]